MIYHPTTQTKKHPFVARKTSQPDVEKDDVVSRGGGVINSGFSSGFFGVSAFGRQSVSQGNVGSVTRVITQDEYEEEQSDANVPLGGTFDPRDIIITPGWGIPRLADAINEIERPESSNQRIPPAPQSLPERPAPIPTSEQLPEPISVRIPPPTPKRGGPNPINTGGLPVIGPPLPPTPVLCCPLD